MAKIKVTRGGCGIQYTDANGNARHSLKTPDSGPFECDDAQAARLVELGVAEYVGLQWRKVADPAPLPEPQPAAEPEEAIEPSQETEKDAGRLDVEQLKTMTNEQLKNLAGDLGIDVTRCKKKADYVAAIVAAEEEIDDEDDGDELPVLEAIDPE